MKNKNKSEKKLSRNSRIPESMVVRLGRIGIRDRRTLSWLIARCVEIALPILEQKA